MAVMTDPVPAKTTEPVPAPRPAELRGRLSRAAYWAAIALALICALLPIVLSGVYAFRDAEGDFTLAALAPVLERDPAFLKAVTLTGVITLCTVALTLGMLTPLVIAVHVWAPHWRPAVEAICTLPLVIPSIALAAGLVAMLRLGAQQGRGTWPNALSQMLQNPDLPIVLIGTYAILCLPFCYRALDAGLRALPLKTFFEASSSLGGNRLHTLMRVVLPNLRRPLLYSAFFSVSLCIGEFTVAATLNQHTLPVWLFMTSSQNFRASIALALGTTVLTWVLLILASAAAGQAGRPARRTRGTRKESR